MPPPTYIFRGYQNSHDPIPTEEGKSFYFHVKSPSDQCQIRFSTFHRNQVSVLQPGQKVEVTFTLTGEINRNQYVNYLKATKIEAVSWAGNVQNPPYQLTGIVHCIEHRQRDVKIVVQHGEDHFNHFRIYRDQHLSTPHTGDQVSLEFELSSYLFDGRHQVFLKITDITVL